MKSQIDRNKEANMSARLFPWLETVRPYGVDQDAPDPPRRRPHPAASAATFPKGEGKAGSGATPSPEGKAKRKGRFV